MQPDQNDCFVIQGKLALPYQYFAGRTGSRFLIALRDEKKIKGVRCGKCSQVFVPPRANCNFCFEDLSEKWVEVGTKGRVSGFTVIRYQEPYQPCRPPYILALIKLDGADTPLVHVVKGVPLDKMKIGLPVEAVFANETTSTIMDIDHFRPVDFDPQL
ncbi:MAG: Zn-ribbon domain-containing OB-fold protein [Pseudomonadota bacterium]